MAGRLMKFFDGPGPDPQSWVLDSRRPTKIFGHDEADEEVLIADFESPGVPFGQACANAGYFFTAFCERFFKKEP